MCVCVCVCVCEIIQHHREKRTAAVKAVEIKMMMPRTKRMIKFLICMDQKVMEIVLRWEAGMRNLLIS